MELRWETICIKAVESRWSFDEVVARKSQLEELDNSLMHREGKSCVF